MSLQSSGTISFDDIKNEFLISGQTGFFDLYRGKIIANYPGTTKIPTSGTISLSDFYSTTRKADPGSSNIINSDTATSFTIGPGIYSITLLLVGGGGGGGCYRGDGGGVTGQQSTDGKNSSVTINGVTYTAKGGTRGGWNTAGNIEPGIFPGGAGSGGQAGSQLSVTVDVTPGTVLTVNVGEGGWGWLAAGPADSGFCYPGKNGRNGVYGNIYAYYICGGGGAAGLVRISW